MLVEPPPIDEQVPVFVCPEPIVNIVVPSIDPVVTKDPDIVISYASAPVKASTD